MTTSNSSFNNISPAKTLADLLAYDDEAFVARVYITLLGRKPDQQGFAYYLERLNRSGDKLGIIYQIFKGHEARRYNGSVAGLKAAMWRYQWKRMPILGGFVNLFDRHSHKDQLLYGLRKIERRIAILEANVIAKQSENENENVDAAISELFSSFDPQKYLDCHPDVAASGMNPYEHFMRHGWREGRSLGDVSSNRGMEVGGHFRDTGKKIVPGTKDYRPQRNEATPYLSMASVQPASAMQAASTSKDIASYFMQPADEVLQDDGYTFTLLMHCCWASRLDLQNAFNIHKPSGRLEYCKWFLFNGSQEYGFPPNVYPKNLLERLILVGGEVGKKAQSMLSGQASLGNLKSVNDATPSSDARGANLIGYAFGEFGMGEHVRMVARSFKTSDTPFCIIDQDVGLHGLKDTSVGHWVTDLPHYGTNIFHINADVFPLLYFKFGESFYFGRYNIGYWAWELSTCPPEFDLALAMVDEVWSISSFVTESFKTRSPVPVITMPLAVTVPDLDASRYTKAYYGLPNDKFVFFFTFDAASYLERKNPIAVVRAFKLAFQNSNENVHLLFKTMNIEVAGPQWGDLLEEIGNDPRISVMSKRLTRDEVLGLNLACDAFVSLHRSEGFGRCVAEAMAYGKPVIVTNYSGTQDFAMEGTACVVDYRLIPVPEGGYPFRTDQVWAEPDVKHAAALMKKLLIDEVYRSEMARAGQKYVLDNFNESVIGQRYAKRLDEIMSMRSRHSIDKDQGMLFKQIPIDGKDEIIGSIDAPTLDQRNQISDAFTVEGWVLSVKGIASVDVFIDKEFIGQTHYGVLRQDVFSAYPDMANAARCGFCYQVDITRLSQGKHTLSVVAKSRSGEIKEWAIDFTLVESTRYQKWLQRSDEVNANKWGRRKTKTNSFFSILLMVTPKPDRELFEQTLKSLADQIHAKFEIVVVAESSQVQEIMDCVGSFGLSGKTRYVANSSNDWMSKVTDFGGQFVGLMDVGDVLRPWALSAVDDVMRINKKVDLIYGDEDSLCEGERCKPIFKPGWSPVFLKNFNYIGRPWFARKSAMVSALERVKKDSTEHTLLIELGSISRSVCHIPSVLVSRANYSIDKFETNKASKPTEAGSTQMTYPKVSIIIPTRLSDIELVDRCFSGLMNLTDYPDMEVIIAVNNVSESTLIENYLSKWPFKIIHWNNAFSWSGINNLGAMHATGDYLLFMNDDIEPIDRNWLKILVNTLSGMGGGVVGPLLKYPNGTIQHLGINFVDYGGGARHLFRFGSGTEYNLQWLMNNPREVSAVTGACLLTTRECYNAVHGFDEGLPLVCNDTDFCIRAREKGYSTIIQPEAKLVHHEGVSRAGLTEVEDLNNFWAKWERLLERGDPFTNPNLDSTRDDWTVNPNIKNEYKYRITNSFCFVPSTK